MDIGQYMKAPLLTLLLLLSGCASTAIYSRALPFPDGTHVDVTTTEFKTSFFNSAVVSAVEDPRTKVIQVFVQGGTSDASVALAAAQVISNLKTEGPCTKLDTSTKKTTQN
jgi:hypothetical protein